MSRAFRDLGHLVKTQFILRWIENPDYRRRIHRQLNKGEALHALRRFLGLDVHNPVFVISSLSIIAFTAGVLTFQAGAAAAFVALRAWLMATFDWVLMGAGNLILLFCLLLVVTPLGRVRLGGAAARPDYSRATWFAMLFAAGMGIGLMFFGRRTGWAWMTYTLGACG